MKNEVNRAPWAKKKTFLFILALCAASAVWGEMTTGPVTYATIAKQNGWTADTYYQTLDVDGVISVTAKWEGTTKNGKSISNTSWRIYQKNLKGEFAINAAPGFIIKTIKLTYATNNNGVCSKTANASPSTTATAAEDQIVSKTVYTVNASSITLYVGVTATTASGDITISLQSIEVTYDMTEPYVTEDFKTPDGKDWSFGVSTTEEPKEGMLGTWKVYDTNAGSDQDILADGKTKTVGLYVKSGDNSALGYITSPAIEGGIKTIVFKWNQMYTNKNGHTYAVSCKVTGKDEQKASFKGIDTRSMDKTFVYSPEIKNNTSTITIKNGNSSTSDNARIVVGPITIVPYLRYTYTEAQQVYDDESTFNCSLQIDNTDGEGTISYSSDNPEVVSFVSATNPEATIVGGGEATITATWSEASTSFKLKVNVLPVPTVTFPGITDGKKSVALDVDPFTEAATVGMTVPIVYSSSNENVAMVNDEGKVTVLTTGTTEITAKVEAKKGEYKEASATYTLTVTASEASEKSFVEKFSGVTRCENDCDYTTEAKNFIGTDGLFHWTVNSVRLRKGDVIGKGGLRFSTSLEEGSYHLLPDPNYNAGIMEGGIKRIAFTYKKAGGGPGANLEISAGEVLRYVISNSGVETPFAANFFVKENTSLKMFNTKGASVVTIGPISIVPYLLFTTKSDEAFLSLVDEYDVKKVLIDNTDDGEVVYSILTEGAKSLISNDGVVTFTDVTESETITIQAAWTPDGESSATVITTMTLYVDAEYGTDKTVEEKFSNYGETGWTNSEENEVTKNGDVYDWRVKLTRHKTSDILVDNQQAIWFAQGGYVATADATDNKKVGPAEGGIKRIAFDWNQNGGNQTGDDLYISVSVDGTEMSAIRRDGGEQPEQPWQYIHNLNVKKNATLKIENKSTTSTKDGGRVKIGTIVITPYLLYTVKDTAIDMTKVATFTNDQLIDNRDDATDIVYSIVGENDDVASINAETGVVTCLKAGTVTIQAAWGDVTTTYMLTIKTKGDVDAHFTTEGKLEKVLADGPFTNAVVVTAGEATPAYESDNTNVAEVDEEGKVTIKGIGTATITATMVETDNFLAWEDSYTVIVRTGVADDNKLVESFSEITKDASTSETEWKGDLQNYFSWKVKSTRHNGTAGDTIGGAVTGTVLFAKGQIATDGVIEGGVKYFTFNWKQPYVEAGATLRLTIEVGEKSYQQDYVVATDNGGTTHEHLYFAGNMQVKKNVQLILKNESFKTDGGTALTGNGRIAIDKFEIVPYLFYTTKVVEKTYVKDGTNTVDASANLINNLEEGETVTYSLSAGAQATISGSTITLANATEDVTVTAACGDVSTTFTLKVTAKTPDFTLENKTAGAFATICLPKKIDHVENATLWSINYGDKTAIEFVVANLTEDAAGMPYLVQVEEDGDVKFFYVDSEEEVTEPVDVVTAKGFVGSLSEGDIEIPNNGTAILISGGRLRIAGAYCVLIKNHAYVDSNNLPASAPVGGAPRRTMTLYNPDMAPTNLVESESESGKAMKVLRDGQFYIIRDTKTYNAQGILVE